MILIKDLGIKDLGGYKKRMCIAQCKQCGRTSERQRIQVVNKEDVVCKSCAVTNRHKSRDDYKMSTSRLGRIFKNMKTRCYNKNYDGKYISNGIIICEQWLNDRNTFYEWAITNGYSDELTIDRINNNGDYEPSNCRWTDNFTQQQNRSRHRSDNTTGYTNVMRTKEGTFSAIIVVAKKSMYLGTFKTAKEAAIKYNQFVIDNKLEHQLNKGI